MDFNYDKQTIFLVENIMDIDFANAGIDIYLVNCAELINNCREQDFTINDIKNILKIVLDEHYNFRKLNKIKKEEWLHFLLEIIQFQFKKLISLDYDFYKFYVQKLNNVTHIGQAYRILQQIVEFKEVIDFDN